MDERNERVQCRFDSYCKHLLKHEIIDAMREQRRTQQREVTFSELSKEEKGRLQYIDQYAPDRHTFNLPDIKVEILDGDLVYALNLLPPTLRNIILWSYLLDYTDMEIANQLGVVRSTIQYRRGAALRKLRKIMEAHK